MQFCPPAQTPRKALLVPATKMPRPDNSPTSRVCDSPSRISAAVVWVRGPVLMFSRMPLFAA